MKIRGLCADYRKLVETAQAQGWIVSRTQNNHLCFQSPCGSRVFASGTTSDIRSIYRVQTKLKRFGFVRM